MEHAGIRIDTEHVRRSIADVGASIKAKETELQETPEWGAWRRKYGPMANMGSRDQLGWLLYTHLGYEPEKMTATGKAATDESALQHIDHPFVTGFSEIQKLTKLRSTFLMGLLAEVEGEYLHPFFNLHVTRTHRSSSDSINFQNIPIRDPMQAAIIRPAFIARPGRRLIESDLSGAEVCVAACYHKDPTMLEYLRTGHDMHRDMAAECFKIDPKMYDTPEAKKHLKKMRGVAKGKFVFAQFYGDWWMSCAKAMWDAIAIEGLVDHKGRDIAKHLARLGITRLGDRDSKNVQPGTFEHHIREVENRFWGERFPVYDQWRDDWWRAYVKQGGFMTLTGFYLSGVFDRNFVINAPVQGSSFHCLLWAIIEIAKEIRQRKMKTLLIGQIHDSLLGDVPDNETEVYAGIVKDVLSCRLPEAWDWIITNINIEIDATPVDGNWHQKAPLKTGMAV